MSIPASAYRTFIAYVEDLPGVLNRITSLLRRRNYNIVSLTVGRTERPGTSRMTIVVEADEDAARRIEANLYKLVNVLWVEDTTTRRDRGARARPREGADRATTRAEVMRLCEVFRARVVDVGPEALVAEITGAADKIDGLVDVQETASSGTFSLVGYSADGAYLLLTIGRSGVLDEREIILPHAGPIEIDLKNPHPPIQHK